MSAQNFINAELFRKVSSVLTSAGEAPALSDHVARTVVREIAPMVQHATNTEPWYQSRVTWGALVSIGAGVLALFGIVLTPEDTALIIGLATSIGTAAGGILTLWGRWKARKPLGSR